MSGPEPERTREMPDPISIARSPCLVAVLLSVLLSPCVASAEADGPDFFDIADPDRDVAFNLRSGPDEGAPTLGRIPGDATRIQNLGCEGGLSFEAFQTATDAEKAAAADLRWCRVAHAGREGWIRARHLVEARTAPGVETAIDEAPPVWRLVSRDGFPVPDAAEIAFDVTGRIFGSTGCNRFETSADMQIGRLVVDPTIATTRMACADDASARLETAMLGLLDERPTMTFNPFADQIELRGPSGQFVFQRIIE